MKDEESSLSERTEKILQASAYAAARFLHTPSWESCIVDVLAHLGSATGSELVYLIYAAHPHDRLRLTIRHYWHGRATDDYVPFEQLDLSEWASSTFAPWVEQMRARKPIACHADDLSPPQQALMRELRMETLYLLPVHTGQGWWGALLFDGEPGRPYTATEFDALGLAAGALGAAIDRHHSEKELHRRNHELNVLNNVIAAANTASDPRTILEITCRELAHSFNASTAGAGLVDETGHAVEIIAEHVTPGNFSALGQKIPITGNASTEFVLQERKPLLVHHVPTDPRFETVRELMASRPSVSIMLLPLFAGNEVVGTLGLDSDKAHHFSEGDLALAMSAASAASQVLTKARLLTAERQNNERLRQILSISALITGIRDEQQLLDTIAREAARFSPSGICTIFTFDSDAEDAMTLRAQHGLADPPTLPVNYPTGLAPQLSVFNRRPTIVEDIDRDAPELRKYGLGPSTRSIHLFPFSAEEQPLGFITFRSNTPWRPSDAEVNALTLLAERVATAIQNVRLLNAVSTQAAHLSALHEVDLAITNSLEPDEVYETITHSAANLLQADIVNLYRWLPADNLLEGLSTYNASEIVVDDVAGHTFTDESNPTHQQLRQNLQPIPITDARNDPRNHPFWRKKLRARSVLMVPLIYRDAYAGLLAINDTRCRRNWTIAEIELAQSLAAQAAIAVANARLHAETRDLLKSSRRQARTVQQIVDTIADGLILLDPDHRIVVANPAAQQILNNYGQTTGDQLVALAGMPLQRFLAPPADKQPFHEIVIRAPRAKTFEIVAHQMEADPLAGGWVIALHDATQEREQMAYVQAQDRLATVGQLAAGIAHDFNNILAVIVLYAQTLQRADVPPRDRERLRAIYQQAQRASSLIAQILDFSRRSVVERRPLELHNFLLELEEMLRRTLPETITLHLDVQTGDAIVNVDPTRLQQALMNLALNARDAITGAITGRSDGTAPGDLHITLARRDPSWLPPLPDMEPGAWIVLTVSDSGPGITDDIMPHIFEPFFTTKMPGQGTGLGLAQVYGIVKQHDGFIDVQNIPGGGTAFNIYLPAIAPLPTPSPLPAPDIQTGAGQRILVVEDDPAIQNAVREILELLGYQVILASDGLEALNTYQEEAAEIDLVLSDMVMPRMDGATLYHALRRLNPQIKLILFTGYPLDETGKTFVEEEQVPWIQKPFSAETLGETINKTLGHQPPGS